MSRSNQTELINPANRFFEWKGGEGVVSYYDKENQQNVTVPLPFKFLILDKVAQITGGIDRNGTYEGFWSNAIRNTKTQQFIVRSKAGVECRGFYEDIKGQPGVRFMQGLYIAYYDDDKNLVIGYLKIKGAALTAWIEFAKAHRNPYNGAFAITGNAKKKKGTTTYYEPVFEHINNVSDEADEAAKELDTHLQEYLTAYFAQAGIAEVETEYTGASIAHGDAWEPTSDIPQEPEEMGF